MGWKAQDAMALLCVLLTLALPGTALAQDIRPPEATFEEPAEEFSPFVDDYFPTRVLFGDTHLHTSWSGDAGMAGATLDPDDAYRFCGQRAKKEKT